MQFNDLAAQQKRIRDVIEANISKVLEHGKYILGPEVGELEKRLCKFTGTRHAIACASGNRRPVDGPDGSWCRTRRCRVDHAVYLYIYRRGHQSFGGGAGFR